MPPLAIMLHCSAEHRVALLTSVIGAFATAEVQKGRDGTQVFQEIPQIQAALQRLILEPMLLSSRLASAQPPPALGAPAGSQAPDAASAALAQQPAAGPSSSQLELHKATEPETEPQAESSRQLEVVDQLALAASSSQAVIQEGSPARHAPQQQQLSQDASAENNAVQQDRPAERPEGVGQSAVNEQQMQQSAEARERGAAAHEAQPPPAQVGHRPSPRSA